MKYSPLAHARQVARRHWWNPEPIGTGEIPEQLKKLEGYVLIPVSNEFNVGPKSTSRIMQLYAAQVPIKGVCFLLTNVALPGPDPRWDFDWVFYLAKFLRWLIHQPDSFTAVQGCHVVAILADWTWISIIKW